MCVPILGVSLYRVLGVYAIYLFKGKAGMSRSTKGDTRGKEQMH
jgi:hypothetical protein